jgi:hypothetical protein
MSFELFWEDVGATWFKGAQVGRSDNDGNYEPGNVKWETAAEQQSNKSNTVLIDTPDGRMTLSQAARLYKMTPGCITYRQQAGHSNENMFKQSQRAMK